MKTAKKVITISFITIAIILLIAFGIKTNKFKPTKTTTPIAQHRNALRVDADDYMPISKRWLFQDDPFTNENIQSLIPTVSTEYTINFKASNNYSCKKISFSRTSTAINGKYRIGIGYTQNNNNTISAKPSQYTKFKNQNYRLIEFETEPTGNLLNILNNIATPLYNNNAITHNGYYENSNTQWQNDCITEIRKSNIIIDNPATIHENGTITIYIDQAISRLYINGTQYTTLNTTINLTNTDICIETNGTPVGIVSYIFTINYFNTLPVIEPEPLPDASQKVTEVLDITGLMFEILTMPFSFITQAFNVTLWEGTPYQFNFSNFILSLIAIATLIFIIKLFTSGFSVISNYTASRDNREFKRSQTKLNNAKTQQIKDNKPQIKHTYVHKDKE